MLLRDHPLMSRNGVRNWPPVWMWIDGQQVGRPQGEIGILTKVTQSNVQPADRCFLHIDHEGSTYVGCLLFDDDAFCSQIESATDSLQTSRC